MVLNSQQQQNIDTDIKFGDSDGPNLCRVKKVDVSSTFFFGFTSFFVL